ncbi:FCD domain-containing protein, partial [Bacillus altitudinis]|uniref:FCD domain-containing protein n=1 Tax=Bacillus altitudinis TaxID=293387 RepID=UPI0011A1FACE
MEELYEVGMGLETVGVKVGWKEGRDREIDEIEEVVRKAEEGMKEEVGCEDIVELEEGFDERIIEGSENEGLCKELNEVNGVIDYCGMFDFRGGGGGERIQKEDRGILSEIKERRGAE